MEYKLDKPISDKKDDLLNRADFAKIVANAITKLSAKGECAVVGIQGEWGSGKTSVARLIGQFLKENEPKVNVIRLETWLATDRESLIKEFFTCILNAINSDGKLHPCYEDVKFYANQFGRRVLRSISFNLGSEVAHASVDMSKIIDEPKPLTLESRKQSINEQLNDADIHPIVFFIDDIDRLSYDEIAILFQLVKNIADFKKIVYVLCYDKEIVGGALDKIHDKKGYRYIEKVVQIPIDIPVPSKKLLDRYFTGLLDGLIEEKDSKLTQFDKIHWSYMYDGGISGFIKNLRDCNRLYNTFAFKYSIIGNDCDFADLLAITLLEHEAPKVIGCLKRNKVTLLESNCGFPISVKTEDAKQLWKYIESACSLEDREALKVVISNLFPKFSCKAEIRYSTWAAEVGKATNKIDSAKYFDRYFCVSLDEGEASNVEIIAWLDSCVQEEFEKWLNIWQFNSRLEDALNEAHKLIRNNSASYKICTKDGFIGLLCAFSNQKFERNGSGFFMLGEQTLRDFIIEDILELLLESVSREEFFSEIFDNPNINISIKCTILKHLSIGYECGYCAHDNRSNDCLLSQEEHRLAQEKFLDCLMQEKEKDDFLFSENCSFILNVWKCLDTKGFKQYIIGHQGAKDILKLVLLCVTDVLVRSSNEGTYMQWYYTTGTWLKELDFDNAVDIAKDELANRKYLEFSNAHRIKFCALLKIAEEKRQREEQGQKEFRIELKFDDFKGICEKYSVLV